MGCDVSTMCTQDCEVDFPQDFEDKFAEISVRFSERTSNNFSNTTSRITSETQFSRKLNLLTSTVRILIKDLPNAANISKITEVWVSETKTFTKDLDLEDLLINISLSSNGNSLLISQEIDGLPNFNFIKSFYFRIKPFLTTNKKRIFEHVNFQISQRFLQSLCPLTITFYLELGLEIDFGIGVEKTMNSLQIERFLKGSSESEKISNWVDGKIQPIPTFCNFSMLDDFKRLNFRIFDGVQKENIAKALGLFENFSVPVPSEIANLLYHTTADEVNCCVEFSKYGVSNIIMQVEISEEIEEILQLRGIEYAVDKWNIFHSLVPPKYFAVELNSEGHGFGLRKISII